MSKGLIIATQFLTLLPVGRNLEVKPDQLPESTKFFVLVGLIEGLVFLLAELLFGFVFSQELTLALAILVLIALTGAFHLDALADTADALSVRADRQKKLAVMKSGSIGPVGVVTLIGSIALKYLALRNISHLLPFTYYSSLLFMPVISKWAMVVALYYGKPVRQDGLGVHFIGKLKASHLLWSTLTLIVVFVLPSLLAGNYTPQSQYFFYIALVVGLYILCRLIVAFYTRVFGGLTGDLVGSINELTEVIFLLKVIVWSRLFI